MQLLDLTRNLAKIDNWQRSAVNGGEFHL